MERVLKNGNAIWKILKIIVYSMFFSIFIVSGTYAAFTDITTGSGLVTGGGGSIAVFDCNLDGYNDLVMNGEQHNDNVAKLFQNDGDSTFTDRSSEIGDGSGDKGRGIAVGDLNNDGFSDIVIGWGNFVYFNNETTPSCTFLETTITTNNIEGISVVDINNDSFLDIWDPGDVAMFHENDRDETFTAQSNAYGISGIVNGNGASMSDVDADGLPDLIWSDTGTTSEIFTNDGDYTYTQATSGSIGLPDDVGAHLNMEWAWADCNYDGYIDVYISGDDNEGLYVNDGDGTFTANATFNAADVSNPNGADWGDYDHDGDVDLLISDNSGTSELWQNNGDCGFTEVASSEGIGTAADIGKTAGFFDVDSDGDLDIVSNEPVKLWRNELNDSNFLRIIAVGRGNDSAPTNYSNKDGIGSRITVYNSSDAMVCHRYVHSSFNQFHPSKIQHCGLDPSKPYLISVQFPSGVNVNKTITPTLESVNMSGNILTNTVQIFENESKPIANLVLDNVAQIYDSTYNQDGNNNIISANFDLESFVQSNYTHSTVTNNERLYINETAEYKVAYSCVWEAFGGANVRRIYQNSIRINGTVDLVPSESDVYIRGNDAGSQAGGHISSTSATVLVNLSAGSYLELRGGEDPGDAGNGMTNSTDDCFMTVQKLNTRAIEVYDSVGGQNIQNIAQTINLDQTYLNNDPALYELNNDQVNVSEDGWYRVSYTSCITQIGGGNRQSPQSWIRKNGNENISLSFSYAGYTRDQQNDRNKNCNRANTIINLSSGDYLELRTGIFDRDSSTQVDTTANRGWLILEKLEMDNSIISINASGQQIEHGGPIAVNFDINDKIGNYVSHSGSSSRVYFDKDGLYELAYNIGYQDGATGDRVITCGKLRKNGNENITPSQQCIYTRGDPQARTGTVSSTSIINVSNGDYVEIMLNVTGEVGTDEDVQIQKGTTWFTIVKINETPTVKWTQPTLNLGTGNLSGGNLSSNMTIKATGEGNEDVEVTCISGDCSVITDDWTDGTDFNGTEFEKDLNFICDDRTVGSYSATYRVDSYEFRTGANITVSCTIEQTYGMLSVILNTPTVGSLTNVIQNRTIELNATVVCSGTTGSICENVTIYSLFNDTATTFDNISTTSGSTPLWTSSSQPQICNLNNTQNCSRTWTLNMTGTTSTQHKIQVNASSNNSEVTVNVSGNTTINITEFVPGTVTWQAASLDLGDGGINLGNLTGTTTLVPADNHSNVTVSCTAGACGTIYDNWTDLTNLTDATPETVQFECDDRTLGNFSAIFGVNSSEDPSLASINVSCEITQTFGQLNVTLVYPPELTNTTVNYRTIFDVNATVVCEGTVGATCGTIEGTASYWDWTLDYGNASDGVRTITAANTVINNYTQLAQAHTPSNDSIRVADVSEFAAGDEILIIQMQDGGGTGVAGRYEFRTIVNISGNIMGLDSTLTRTYGSGSYDQIGATATQVVKVPHYSNLTINAGASITAPAWNGSIGGVVAFRATQNLDTDGYINVSHTGYRGGDCNGCGNDAWGDQGEGTSGLGTTSTGSNENGGGGGEGPSASSGPGSGGGYGTSGGNSSGGITNSFGGDQKGGVELNTMFLGGGAGGGGDNDARTPFPENVDGGGIVFAFAKNILDARIHSKGEPGIFGDSAASGGVSGSGAGGTIWLGANSMNLSDVNASGGPETAGDGAEIGGYGGDGRIRLDVLELISGSTSDPSAGLSTSDNFTLALRKITNTSSTDIFVATNTQTQTCSDLDVGDPACEYSWDVNVTSSNEIFYNLTVNATSDSPNVMDNSSLNATVNINADAFITIINPLNNSNFLDTDNITGNITSTLPIIWAAFYIDGNKSFNYTMTDLGGGTRWGSSAIQNLTAGLHNITFAYNETPVQQNTTATHWFTVAQDHHSILTKAVTNIGNNMYLIKLYHNNTLDRSQDSRIVEFVDTDYNPASFTPSVDMTYPTHILPYFGTVYGWNNTLTPTSLTEFNYSITGITANTDYNLLDAYIVGFE